MCSTRFGLAAMSVLAVSSAGGQERQIFYRLTGGGEADREFSRRLQNANQLASQRKFADAVKEIVWCLDNRTGSDAQFENSGTHALVRLLRDIDRVYSPAGKLLEKRRKRIEKKFRAGEGDFDAAHELHETNKALLESERTLELYDDLEGGDKDAERLRRFLFQFVEEEMILEDRFEEFLKGAGRGPANLDRRLADAKRETESWRRSIGDKAVDEVRRVLCRSAARYYKALLATGEAVRASRLADRFTEFHKTGETYALFMRQANELEKREASMALKKEAVETLPKDQHGPVKREAKYIPKKKQ